LTQKIAVGVLYQAWMGVPSVPDLSVVPNGSRVFKLKNTLLISLREITVIL